MTAKADASAPARFEPPVGVEAGPFWEATHDVHHWTSKRLSRVASQNGPASTPTGGSNRAGALASAFAVTA